MAMADREVEALKQKLEDYASGKVSSDLFEGSAVPSAPEQSPASSANASASPAASGGQDAYTKARAVVLRKLTGSPKSRHQLAVTLREREFDEQVITDVLDRMEEVQLIDDAAFAHAWVRTRHELKGLGAAVLRRELQEKGISPEHIESALDQLSAEDEDAAARELIDNKLRGVTIPVGHGAEDRKEREKIIRRLVSMLGRRGHAPGAAFQLVREAIETRTA